MDWKQVFGGVVVGAILGIGAHILFQERRTATLEAEVEHLKSQIGKQTQHVHQPQTNASNQTKSGQNPNALVSIIQNKQKLHVKESWGELAHECFTDNDLKNFISNRTASRISLELKHNPQFLDVVFAIRKMEHSERLALLKSANKPLRDTWAKLGKITREGQTLAGQKAEQLIAQAIVDLVNTLIKLPEREFKQLYDAHF